MHGDFKPGLIPSSNSFQSLKTRVFSWIRVPFKHRPEPKPQPIERLKNRTNAWIKGRLWLQVVLGLLAGIVLGSIIGPDLGLVKPEIAILTGNWLALPGKLFLGLIGMVVYVLVLASIIRGLSASPGGKELQTVGLKLTLFVTLTTAAAAAIGIILSLIIKPGSFVEITLPERNLSAPVPVPEMGTLKKTESIKEQVPEMISHIIPQNPFASLVRGEMLGIVVFAILIGIACITSDQKRVLPFLNFLDALLEISMTVVKWAMFLAPWAVFGLMAQLVSRVGFNTIMGMGVYVLTVLVGLLILLLGYFALIVLFTRTNLLDFASKIGSVQLLAFSTSSSAAVMPLTINTAVTKLNIPPNIANLVVPLGATVNMAGTALYQGVAMVFLADMSGIVLSIPEIILIILTLVASSIGSPGTPGVGIVILSNVAGNFGIPTEGMVLIMGVDRILDMSRTTVNVTGDLTACLLLSPKERAPAQQPLPEV
jgi:Na+/H+-dicarboxylate symporter